MGQFIDTNIVSPKELYIPKFIKTCKNTFEIYIVHWFVIYFIYYLLGGRPIKSL